MNTKAVVPVKKQFKNQLDKMKEEGWGGALPPSMSPAYFSRCCWSHLTANTDLLECDLPTVMRSFITIAQLGLVPESVTGQAYVVPYGKTAQPIIGYRGLMQLAFRSGQIANIDAQIVREGDDFSFNYGRNADLKHVPMFDDSRPVTHYYACATTKSGGFVFVVMSYDQMQDFKKKFCKTTSNKSPWNSDFDAMAKKTCIRRLATFLPMSTEMVTATSLTEPEERAQYGAKPAVSADDDIMDAEVVDEHSGA